MFFPIVNCTGASEGLGFSGVWIKKKWQCTGKGEPPDEKSSPRCFLPLAVPSFQQLAKHFSADPNNRVEPQHRDSGADKNPGLK